jgi:hypothetical protein
MSLLVTSTASRDYINLRRRKLEQKLGKVTEMEGTDQRFTQPNFDLDRPSLRGIYFTAIRPSLAEFFGVFFLTFGLYSAAVMTGQDRSGFAQTVAVVFLYISIFSITRTIRYVLDYWIGISSAFPILIDRISK